jgi:hypothetical protein
MDTASIIALIIGSTIILLFFLVAAFLHKRQPEDDPDVRRGLKKPYK